MKGFSGKSKRKLKETGKLELKARPTEELDQAPSLMHLLVSGLSKHGLLTDRVRKEIAGTFAQAAELIVEGKGVKIDGVGLLHAKRFGERTVAANLEHLKGKRFTIEPRKVLRVRATPRFKYYLQNGEPAPWKETR